MADTAGKAAGGAKKAGSGALGWIKAHPWWVVGGIALAGLGYWYIKSRSSSTVPTSTGSSSDENPQPGSGSGGGPGTGNPVTPPAINFDPVINLPPYPNPTAPPPTPTPSPTGITGGGTPLIPAQGVAATVLNNVQTPSVNISGTTFASTGLPVNEQITELNPTTGKATGSATAISNPSSGVPLLTNVKSYTAPANPKPGGPKKANPAQTKTSTPNVLVSGTPI